LSPQADPCRDETDCAFCKHESCTAGRCGHPCFEALKKGRPGFAAIDVYEDEPVVGGNYPLLKMPNVVCTPHLGYVEQSTYESYYGSAIDSILGFADGKPVNVLNPEALSKK
jgi:D-3-phosphoglycerate dehydrogenase